MSPLALIALTLSASPDLLDRYEPVGWNGTTIAVRETYDVSEPGGGTGAKDCKYPGTSSPTQGVKLHFVAWKPGVPLDVKEAVKAATTYTVYESVPEGGTCTPPEKSKAELQSARDHAAELGIDLAAKLKVVALGGAGVRGDQCFLGSRARACAGNSKVAGTRLGLRFQLTSSSPCSLHEGRMDRGCEATLRAEGEASLGKESLAFGAQQSSEMASSFLELAPLEAYVASEADAVFKLPYRMRFLGVSWELPFFVLVTLP